jgi:predicted TPR repeat methyltransferase
MSKTMNAVDVFNNYAQKYQDKFMNMDLYHDTFDLFCEHIAKVKADIFEIGCGPGNITKHVLSKRPEFKVTGIDFAPNMVALAKANNPSAHFSVMDAREIDKLTSKFDGIIAGFCLPYLSKTEASKLISDCSFLLKKGGILYLSTMEDEYEKSGYISSSDGQSQTYTYYHQADYLINSLDNNGFELIATVRKEYPQHDGSLTTDLVLMSKKK